MSPIFDQAHFARLWRQLDAREEAEPDPDLWPDTVWLECTGELLRAAGLDSTARAAASVTSRCAFANR